jgi:hypothetical protein
MKGKAMKVTNKKLLIYETVLAKSVGRGNFPTNYMIDRNIEHISSDLKTFRKARALEPICWFVQSMNTKDEKGKKNNITPEQVKQGENALEALLNEEVDFEPHRLPAAKLCDSLRSFSKAREELNEEELNDLNVNFWIVLRELNIITDE